MNATQPHIVAITDDFASIAKAIGKDKVKVTSLVKGSKNLHNITPKTSMAIKVRSADLLIRLGMNQDSWIDGLIHVSKNSNILPGKPGYLDASKNIKKLEVPTQNTDGQHGDVHIEGNPHYWLNPNNGKIIATQIKNHLCKIDPTNTDFYETNLVDFNSDLDKRIVGWKKALEPLNQVQIISYHKVWSYFYDAFNLTGLGEIESLPGIPPSVKHLKRLNNKVNQSNKEVIVITASYFPQKSSKKFAKKIDASFMSLYTNVDGKKIKNYPELFDYLVKELSK